MFLVFIKSYRDNSVDLEELKRSGRLFYSLSSAEAYKYELNKVCSGWLEAEILEINDSP